jgi:hypothetical protein
MSRRYNRLAIFLESPKGVQIDFDDLVSVRYRFEDAFRIAS